MDLETFKASTKGEEPPKGLSTALEAMWYQGKDNWEEAHRLAQSESSPTANWAHAHLHRVEGDIVNASYWYRLAKKAICSSSLEDEWEDIVTALV